jgi:hypothetical protein
MRLGYVYYAGFGVERDLAQWVRWTRASADQGYAPAQANMAFMYQRGAGVPRDTRETVRWASLAAEGGDASGQTILGFCYAHGEGIRKDQAAAVHWWQKAAEQGAHEAAFNLGVAYRDGRGTPKDRAQAMHWLEKAAELGDADGAYALAVLYYGSFNPFGPHEHDTVGSYSWLLIAKELAKTASQVQSDQAAAGSLQKIVGAQMTPADKAEAQRRADDWLRAHPRPAQQ